MALYPTPHIGARPEDFAKTVLMPGDPLRAKFIAENFFFVSVLIFIFFVTTYTAM